MVTAEAVIQGTLDEPDVATFTHILSIYGGAPTDQERLQAPPGSTLECKQIFLPDSPVVDIIERFPGQ